AWKSYILSNVWTKVWKDPNAIGLSNTNWWSVFVGAISSQITGTTKKAVKASITMNHTSNVPTRRLDRRRGRVPRAAAAKDARVAGPPAAGLTVTSRP